MYDGAFSEPHRMESVKIHTLETGVLRKVPIKNTTQVIKSSMFETRKVGGSM